MILKTTEYLYHTLLAGKTMADYVIIERPKMKDWLRAFAF